MGDRLKLIGMHVARYGLVIVLLWIGGMKFTAYEAEGIKPLVANSPLMSWVYRVMSVGGFSSLLGVVEIAIGVLNRTPTGVASGLSRGQRARGGDFSDHAELPGHHARVGAEPGRLPRPVGHAGAIRAQGRRPVGGGAVFGRRGVGSSPTASCRRGGRLPRCHFVTTRNETKLRGSLPDGAAMPRQNRVTLFGEIVAVSERGTVMGVIRAG
jgi:Protein of unknown function, DUF417